MRALLVPAVLLWTSCATHAGRHRYPVPDPVGSIVRDDAAFATFAAALRPDLEAEARSSADPAIQKARWFVLAMLDGLAGDLDAASRHLDQAAALEPRAAARAMLGLSLRALIDARGGSYAAALEHRVSRLPLDDLREELQMLRAMAETFTPEVCAELLEGEVGPRARDHTVSIDDAHAIVFQRYAVVVLVPHASEIRDVLAARGIEP